MSDAPRPFGQMTRRHWLGHLASTALGVPAIQFFSSLEANAQQLRKTNRSCIVLWMGGRPQPPRHLGPEARQREERRPVQADRDLGPGREDHRASAQGRQADASPEHHPLARLQGREPRSRHLPDAHRLHPQPDGRAPGLRLGTARWSWASGSRTSTCRIASRSTRRASAPASWGCRTPRSSSRTRTHRSPICSRPRTSRTGGWSGGCRCSARSRTSSPCQRAAQAAVDHKAVYAKTLRMMNSRYQDTFNLDHEPAAVRDAYGRGSFGSGCLMARRLVEQGVTYVEVSLDGWDTHTNNFDTLSQRLLPELDKGMSALVADLAAAPAARHHDDRLDGRVRPHAADQPERRPRSLAAKLVGRRRRRRHEERPGHRRDRQGRRRHRRPSGRRDGPDRHHDQDDGHQPRDPVHDAARPADQDRRRRHSRSRSSWDKLGVFLMGVGEPERQEALTQTGAYAICCPLTREERASSQPRAVFQPANADPAPLPGSAVLPYSPRARVP